MDGGQDTLLEEGGGEKEGVGEEVGGGKEEPVEDRDLGVCIALQKLVHTGMGSYLAERNVSMYIIMTCLLLTIWLLYKSLV